ncbi:MAG: DinB family protein [Acidobacteriota bacterium]|nr:DinB family protein [Acidobacteriota bacterium]
MSPASPGIPTALTRGPGADFRELSARYLEEYLAKIDACLEQLGKEQLWWRPNEASNSVGNLVLHLVGNLSMWILVSLGDSDYQRRRSEEFQARETHDVDQLRAALAEVVAQCRRVLERLPESELARPRQVQGYDIDGLGIVYHAVEHMSYHTGQIVWVTKTLAAPSAVDFYPQHAGE